MRCLVEVQCLIAIADRRIRSRMDFNEQSIGTRGNRRQSDINNMTLSEDDPEDAEAGEELALTQQSLKAAVRESAKEFLGQELGAMLEG